MRVGHEVVRSLFLATFGPTNVQAESCSKAGDHCALLGKMEGPRSSFPRSQQTGTYADLCKYCLVGLIQNCDEAGEEQTALQLDSVNDSTIQARSVVFSSGQMVLDANIIVFPALYVLVIHTALDCCSVEELEKMEDQFH